MPGTSRARCGSQPTRRDAPERVKDRLEQAERAVEKFVSRRLKAVQPGLQKVYNPPCACECRCM